MQCMKSIILALSLALAASAFADPVCRDHYGRICRSKKVLSDFRKTVPCPATGQTGKRCHGYIIDHIKALSCAKTEEERARLDSVGNLQYQTIADAKAKDRIERKMCGYAG